MTNSTAAGSAAVAAAGDLLDVPRPVGRIQAVWYHTEKIDNVCRRYKYPKLHVEWGGNYNVSTAPGRP